MAQPELTADRVRTLLHYDPDTGVFTNRVHRGSTARAGHPAGCRSIRDGYLRIRVDGVLYLSHRLAWLYAHGAWPRGEVDHRNGVRADNRLENLRDASSSMNSQNQRTARRDNKTTGLLGASYMVARQRYRASIFVEGKHVHLGLFATALEAHSAYLAAKRAHHPGCTI